MQATLRRPSASGASANGRVRSPQLRRGNRRGRGVPTVSPMHPAPQPSQPVERKPLKLRCIEQRDEKAAVLLDYLDGGGVGNAQRRVRESGGESEWGLSFPPAVVVEAPEKVLRPISAFQRRRGYAVGCLTGHVVPDEREGRDGQHRVA